MAIAAVASSCSPPISDVSSSATIFTTCWPGFSAPITSLPRQRSRSAAVNWRTTLRFTSASSSARRIVRSAASTSCSLSVPRLRTSASAPCSFSVSESNTVAFAAAPLGGGAVVGVGRLRRGRNLSRAAAQRLADAAEGLGELRGHDEHLVGVAFGELGQHLQVFVAEQLAVWFALVDGTEDRVDCLRFALGAQDRRLALALGVQDRRLLGALGVQDRRLLGAL